MEDLRAARVAQLGTASVEVGDVRALRLSQNVLNAPQTNIQNLDNAVIDRQRAAEKAAAEKAAAEKAAAEKAVAEEAALLEEWKANTTTNRILASIQAGPVSIVTEKIKFFDYRTGADVNFGDGVRYFSDWKSTFTIKIFTLRERLLHPEKTSVDTVLYAIMSTDRSASGAPKKGTNSTDGTYQSFYNYALRKGATYSDYYELIALARAQGLSDGLAILKQCAQWAKETAQEIYQHAIDISKAERGWSLAVGSALMVVVGVASSLISAGTAAAATTTAGTASASAAAPGTSAAVSGGSTAAATVAPVAAVGTTGGGLLASTGTALAAAGGTILSGLAEQTGSELGSLLQNAINPVQVVRAEDAQPLPVTSNGGGDIAAILAALAAAIFFL